MPRDHFSPPTPPSREEEEYDIDDPWQYATEYDFLHRHDMIVPQTHAIAFHVHNVFDNLRDNFEEIMTTLGGSINISLLQLNNHEIIQGLDNFFLVLLSKFHRDAREAYDEFGDHSQKYYQLTDDGKENYNKLSQITQKLKLAGNEYLTFDTTNNIFTWIQFVLRQPESFQRHYLECFIRDTYYAYDGLEEGGNISCPKGIYERLLFSISDACLLYCSQYKKRKKKTRKTKGSSPHKQSRGGSTAGKLKSTYHSCDNPVYRKLIQLFKKEVPDMNELTKEWSAIFEGDLGDTLTPSQLKQDFIDFMDRKYKLYGLDQMKAINIRANDLEAADIFKNKAF